MADDVDDLDNLTGLAWAVGARNKIQSLMLDLWQRAESKSLPQDHLQLAVGAAFSLWRAVFLMPLAERERTPKLAGGKATAFLKKVISTNTVTFGDDLTHSPWTGGYYLNNARYRLGELYTRTFDDEIGRTPAAKLWNRYFILLRDGLRWSFSGRPRSSRTSHSRRSPPTTFKRTSRRS